MIIFNEKEYYNHFFEKNDRMLNITSDKTLEQLYQMLLNGHSITSVATITGTKGFKDNTSGMKQMSEHTKLLLNPLTRILNFNENMPSMSEYAYFDEDDAHEEANKLVQETIKIQNERPAIFFDKECQTFNLPLKKYDSLEEWTDYTNEDLIVEIGDALGILPNLQKPDIPFEDQKHLSVISKDLFLPNNVIKLSNFNGLPTYDELKYYDSLPKIQKDLLHPEYDHLKFHPVTLLTIIKEKYNGLINNDQLKEEQLEAEERYESFNCSGNIQAFNMDRAKELMNEQKEAINQQKAETYSQLIAEADTLFKEKFHGRSPRVLNTLVSGYAKVYPRITAEKIVDEFSQQNVSKVAKYNNESLLVLSGMFDFNQLKESHIPILGSCLTTDNIKTYNKNGFLKWYKGNATKITDTDLAIFCEKAGLIPNIKKDTTIKDLMNSIINDKGFQDMKRYEADYHYKFSDNMVAIRGRNIVCSDNNYTMYLLKSDDIRNFTVGYDTHCCQHYGSAGSTCVMKLTREPFAGATVIEKNGKIVGQAFVWTDEDKDTFVFDNMEFANDADISLYESVIAEYVKQLPYKNVHIGTGFLAGGMAGWGNKIQSSQFASMPNLIDRGHVYSDYHESNARVLKDRGRVLIHPEHPVQTHKEREDNSNRLLDPENLWALQIHGKTVAQKLQLLDEVSTINEWNASKQLEWVQSSPILIKKIDNPPEMIQLWVADNFPEYIQYIHHPVSAIIEQRILQHPEDIDIILDENAEFILSSEFSNRLLSDHPSILKKLFSLNAVLDVETLHGIVRQNPYNIRTIPERYLTDEIKNYAIELEPKLATLLNVPESTLLRAVTLNPNIGALMDEIPEEMQIAMVRSNSASISNIKHPCREAVTIAVQANPLLIRNYQYDYPELIPDCIVRNNSVINVIKHPTSEYFALLNGYVPTNPYIKRDYMTWHNNLENTIER